MFRTSSSSGRRAVKVAHNIDHIHNLAHRAASVKLPNGSEISGGLKHSKELVIVLSVLAVIIVVAVAAVVIARKRFHSASKKGRETDMEKGQTEKTHGIADNSDGSTPFLQRHLAMLRAWKKPAVTVEPSATNLPVPNVGVADPPTAHLPETSESSLDRPLEDDKKFGNFKINPNWKEAINARERAPKNAQQKPAPSNNARERARKSAQQKPVRRLATGQILRR